MGSCPVEVVGLGKDVWTLRDDQITNFGKFFYILEILYFFQEEAKSEEGKSNEEEKASGMRIGSLARAGSD